MVVLKMLYYDKSWFCVAKTYKELQNAIKLDIYTCIIYIETDVYV